MAVELILNDLSCSKASDIAKARSVMSDFIQGTSGLTSKGIPKILRAKNNIQSIELAENYNIAKWRNDTLVSQEQKTFFKSLTSKTPALADYPSLADLGLKFECISNGTSSDTLVAVWLMDAIAISLKTSTTWNTPSLEAQLKELTDNGNLTIENIALRNVADYSHVQSHISWIEEKKRSRIRSGADLTVSQPTFLPKIIFCQNVKNTLQVLNEDDDKLKQLIKKLLELNKIAENWMSPFDPSRASFKISPESQSTLEQYGAERVFACPDGQNRTFSLHFRITPHAWRCHFFPDEEQKVILIGYVGPHLPTP